jgi:hypothetical protein
MNNKIKEHLDENNMTYCQHFKFAAFYGFFCLVAGCALIIHAIFPCWFQHSGSDLITVMALIFEKRRLEDT